MKTSMVCLCPEFNMHRMAMQYAAEYYLVAHRRYLALKKDDCDQTRALSAWQSRLSAEWPGISVEAGGEQGAEVEFGGEVLVSVRVVLNALTPDDVTVQALFGRVDADGGLQDPVIVPMKLTGEHGSAGYLYQTVLRPSIRSGLHGYTIRVLPRKSEYVSQFLPGLITWAQQGSVVPELQPR